MSVIARIGSVALLASLIALASPGLAQTDSDAPSGSWTDPPVKSAADKGAPETKPAEALRPAAEAPATPAPDKSKDGAVKDSAAPPAQVAPAARAASRSAGVRRAYIRQAARARSVAQAPAAIRPRLDRTRMSEQPRRGPRTSRSAERPRLVARHEPRSLVVERFYRRVASRRDRWIERNDDEMPVMVPYDRPDAPMYAGRRSAGWGELLGDNRARRIAQARAAGFLVMRSRTIEYPDGRRVNTLTPYDGGDPNDF